MKKVILVDDERIVLDSIKALVDWESSGVEVVACCNNGLEALEAAKTYKPDIVITDIKMPVMDGLELISKIKEICPDTSYIVLTGYGEFELAKKAIRQGVSDYLLKPCSEEDIKNAVDKLIREKEEQDQMVREEVKKRLLENELPPESLTVISESKSGRDFVDDILDYLDAHFCDENVNLKFVAREVVFLNEDYVGKKFVHRTGRKFTEVLNDRRIEKAKFLLVTTDENNETIATAVGYGKNPQYFNKIFKKLTGFTPKEFRERQKYL